MALATILPVVEVQTAAPKRLSPLRKLEASHYSLWLRRQRTVLGLLCNHFMIVLLAQQRQAKHQHCRKDSTNNNKWSLYDLQNDLGFTHYRRINVVEMNGAVVVLVSRNQLFCGIRLIQLHPHTANGKWKRCTVFSTHVDWLTEIECT